MLNAILGLIIFEYCWYKMWRFRQPIKELEDLMPAYRRYDSNKWSKWKFYPGAVTCMLPRFIFGVSCFAFLCVFLFFALIGQSMDKPISGCRRLTIRGTYKFVCFMFSVFTNFNFPTWHYMTLDEVSHYEEWLGPRAEQAKE